MSWGAWIRRRVEDEPWAWAGMPAGAGLAVAAHAIPDVAGVAIGMLSGAFCVGCMATAIRTDRSVYRSLLLRAVDRIHAEQGEMIGATIEAVRQAKIRALSGSLILVDLTEVDRVRVKAVRYGQWAAVLLQEARQ